MLNFIKKVLPKPIKHFLIKIKKRTIDAYRKQKLAEKMQIKHQLLTKSIKNKEKIKVVFLAIHESIWKVDRVFKRMLDDPYFEPEVLVIPYTVYGEERMIEDMENSYRYFKNKSYKVSKALQPDNSWVTLEQLSPDLVFFTNPYNLTRQEYYEDAYLNYLCCYVPYYFMATKHAGDECQQFNNNMFLASWKLYWPHDYCYQIHKLISINKGFNGLVTGYPATETVYLGNNDIKRKATWKSQTYFRKKIIYAPHHTIETTVDSLSSFLSFGNSIKKLAERYQRDAQWSFKPHPILKSKLYLHPDWGKEKTDAYYNFWDKQAYTQLDEGEYEELFLSSDAIIHDCSSFIVEYAFTGKPCLYLVNKNNLKGLLNEFGEGVMQLYEQARAEKEIETFVSRLVNEAILPDKSKRAYFDSYVEEYYKKKLPSERIIEDIKQSLGVLNVN